MPIQMWRLWQSLAGGLRMMSDAGLNADFLGGSQLGCLLVARVMLVWGLRGGWAEASQPFSPQPF